MPTETEQVPTMRLAPPSGCDKCAYGLISPPPPDNSLPLYTARRVQYEESQLKFCTCRAGVGYRGLLARLAREARAADVRLPKAVAA